jgi:hypothetical protein
VRIGAQDERCRQAEAVGQRFGRENTGSGSGEIVHRTQDPHAAPGVEHKKIVIAANDDLGPSRESELQILIVLWIAAVGYPHRRLKPDSRTPEDFEDALTARQRNHEREPGAAQDSGNLRVDRGREGEYIGFFGPERCPP